MKNFFIGLAIFLFILFVVLRFGIQIGNVTIGRRPDTLKAEQKIGIEQSQFYQQYLNNDKLIVMNYWATWCQPCVGEMPELNKVKDKYKSQDIAFISFSIDTDSLKLAKFNKSGKFQFTDVTVPNLSYKNAILNFLEHRSLDESISMQSVPVTYIIKNKKVLKKFDGTVEGGELAAAIDESLKQ